MVIRCAGDSGDGMQPTGDRFTTQTTSFGNDLSTPPNLPAEIRAPAGTLPGVPSFQLHVADHDILTPGDVPDVLVAMNPAARKANLPDLPAGADAIVEEHGQPIRFGPAGGEGVIRDRETGRPHVAPVTADNEADVHVHDAHEPNPTTAFALSRLADPDTLHHTPIGILRQVSRPDYDTQMAVQLDAAIEHNGKGDLAALLAGADTWTVKE